MNKDFLEGLSNVIRGLENIEVKGKANLLNLGGSIAILEELRQQYITDMTQRAAVNDKEPQNPKE